MMNLRKKFPHVQESGWPSSSERKQFMMKNGSILQEKLIATFGARYKLPIRCFTAKEIIRATNNFAEVASKPSFFLGDLFFDLIKGCFQEREILVAKVRRRYIFPGSSYPSNPDGIIHNIVISSQMSHLKHVLKLLGCCLEFEFPILVYEDINVSILNDLLYEPEKGTLFTWRSRVNIIKDIAYTMAYLHSAFPTPIIHQRLDLFSVFIDQSGIPKFLDFSHCLPLPPGKMQIQVDSLRGTVGFIDPEFILTLCGTPKIDVYSIGVLLLVLVTGRKAMEENGDGAEPTHLVEYIKDCLINDQLNKVVVSEIWESDDRAGKQEQLKTLVELALRCTQVKGEDRPHMIDVAKKLHDIQEI